ncbi:MAG: hypothetical protein V8Q27_00380 [Eubacteriales bacterium]
MRCYNCNKKFDYEKYYGICPKCGCFNRQETAEEQHEAVHDRFGDSSDEDCHRSHRTFSAHPGEKRDGSFTYQGDGYTYTAFEKGTAKKKVVGFFGILHPVLCAQRVPADWNYNLYDSQSHDNVFVNDPENGSGLEIVKHEAVSSFIFQEKMTLQVLECREVADSSIFPTMEEGSWWRFMYRARATASTRITTGFMASIWRQKAITGNPFPAIILSPTLRFWACIRRWMTVPSKGEAYCDGWYGFLVDAIRGHSGAVAG